MTNNFDHQTYGKTEEILNRLDALERKIDAIAKVVGVPEPPKATGPAVLPRSVKAKNKPFEW